MLSLSLSNPCHAPKTAPSNPIALSSMKCCRLRLRNSSCTRHSALGASDPLLDVCLAWDSASIRNVCFAHAAKQRRTPCMASIIVSRAWTCSITTADLRPNWSFLRCACIRRPRKIARMFDRLMSFWAAIDLDRRPAAMALKTVFLDPAPAATRDNESMKLGDLETAALVVTSLASKASWSMSKAWAFAFTKLVTTARASSLETRSFTTLSFASSCRSTSFVTHAKGSKAAVASLPLATSAAAAARTSPGACGPAWVPKSCWERKVGLATEGRATAFLKSPGFTKGLWPMEMASMPREGREQMYLACCVDMSVAPSVAAKVPRRPSGRPTRRMTSEVAKWVISCTKWSSPFCPVTRNAVNGNARAPSLEPNARSNL
mmetsp:Transcript_23157/g.65067  ORF Transcript_23157/g.65067 Transcript_23157/m.65067 type:complete len:376 (+) Transcript_23157:714-1841(+)